MSLLGRPGVLIHLLFVVITVVGFSFLVAFALLVVVFLVTTFVIVVVFLFLFFDVSIVVSDKCLQGLIYSVARSIFNLFDSSERIDLRMRLRGNSHQPIRHGTWQLDPTDKVSLVVSHVQGSEESTHEELELLVRLVHHVVFVLSESLQVVERNSVSLDSHFLDELSKVTVSAFTEVSQQTVFMLVALLQVGIVGDILIDFLTHNVLVSEHLSNGSLVNFHATLVSVLHRVLVVTESVLHLEVGLLGKLSKLSHLLFVDQSVEHIVVGRASLVLD